MKELFNLKNKVILFTGGYGYLGTSSVNALAEYGAKVYVLGRDINKFNETFQSRKNIFFEKFDLSETNSIKNAFKNIYEKEKKIDTLINNAFYSKGQSPEHMKDEEFSYGVEGTLNTLYYCIREIIPYLKDQKSGKIINVSSMYGVIAPEFSVYDESPQFLNPPHYGAAKAGVIQLTKYFASYLGKFNIQVNSITPGAFPSTEVQKDKEFINRLKEKTLLNRVGEPDDLAGAFVFLSSNSSDYLTGQNIVVDGGWTVI